LLEYALPLTTPSSGRGGRIRSATFNSIGAQRNLNPVDGDCREVPSIAKWTSRSFRLAKSMLDAVALFGLFVRRLVQSGRPEGLWPSRRQERRR